MEGVLKKNAKKYVRAFMVVVITFYVKLFVNTYLMIFGSQSQFFTELVLVVVICPLADCFDIGLWYVIMYRYFKEKEWVELREDSDVRAESKQAVSTKLQ